MGSVCHKSSNSNKIFSNTEDPLPLSHLASKENISNKPLINLQKVPMHSRILKDEKLIIEDQNNKIKEPPPISQPKDLPQTNVVNNSRPKASENSDEKTKTFLSNKIPESLIKSLGGGVVVRIKETGEVVNREGKTLGFFHDHWKYYDTQKLKGFLREEKIVFDENNHIIGSFGSNGMIISGKGETYGKIEESGSIRDHNFKTVLKFEGEIKRVAFIYFFMHPELKNQYN